MNLLSMPPRSPAAVRDGFAGANAVTVTGERIWTNPRMQGVRTWSASNGELFPLLLSGSPRAEDIVTRVKISRNHGRSALILDAQMHQVPRTEFMIFHESVKGAGYVHEESEHVGEIGTYRSNGSVSGARGGFNGWMLKRIVLASEALLNQGIRTEVPEQVYFLEELLFNGERMPLGQAIREGWIPSKYREDDLGEIPFSAAQLVRAHGISYRVGDLAHLGEEETGEVLRCTFSFLNKEADMLSLTRERFALESAEGYGRWVAATFGEYAAKMHNAGLRHGNLIAHNIGLDASILDLDTVRGKLVTDRESTAFERELDIIHIFSDWCGEAGLNPLGTLGRAVSNAQEFARTLSERFCEAYLAFSNVDELGSRVLELLQRNKA